MDTYNQHGTSQGLTCSLETIQVRMPGGSRGKKSRPALSSVLMSGNILKKTVSPLIIVSPDCDPHLYSNNSLSKRKYTQGNKTFPLRKSAERVWQVQAVISVAPCRIWWRQFGWSEFWVGKFRDWEGNRKAKWWGNLQFFIKAPAFSRQAYCKSKRRHQSVLEEGSTLSEMDPFLAETWVQLSLQKLLLGSTGWTFRKF